MRLRYETKKNPVMTCILIFISIAAFSYVLLKADLTNMVFGTVGTPEPPVRTMSNEQYAEVLALWREKTALKQDAVYESGNQIAMLPPETGHKSAPLQANEPGSIYQYIDSSGITVIVDDLNKVPSQYRTKMKTSSAMYGQQRTTVMVQNNQIWVPVTFGYRGINISARLLLDTGATNTSISPALARRLGVQATETTRGTATLADGRMVQTAHVTMDYVTVGPKVRQNVNVQILPRPGDEETGLLGMNFLGEFPHIVETRAGIIRWQ